VRNMRIVRAWFPLLLLATLSVGCGADWPLRPSAKTPATPAPQTCAEGDFQRLRGGDCALATDLGRLGALSDWHPVLLALLGTGFGWLMTALGSAAVVIHVLNIPERQYRKVLDFMLGVSGGVMTAASYWSLLAPALEFAENGGWGQHAYLPVAIGFLSGGLLLQASDALLSSMQSSLEELDLYKDVAKTEATATRSQRLRRLIMLILAITIHNFPEGMAVGVGFGAVGSTPGATLGGAVSLALGIGIQNFPEGLAVSMPLMREGVSPLKAFWYGQLSGVVEPIGGLIGAAFVHYCKPMLPFTMSLAAGAMIFVVADSLVPEMQAHGNKALAMQGLMLGFVIMMVLDVTLG